MQKQTEGMADLITKYVDKKFTVQFGKLSFDVVVVDVKRSYGQIRYKVVPVAGSGSAWVESIK